MRDGQTSAGYVVHAVWEVTLPEGKSPAQATLLVGVLFMTGLFAGAWTGASAAARAQDPYDDLELFVQVLTTIETDYVEPVDSRELVDAAIRGMVDHLDAHSRWLSASEYAELHQDTTGHYDGIGVEVVRDEDGPVTVTKVMPGSPARRDGLQAGDHIVAVNGEPISDLDLSDIAMRLKGPRGEPLSLTIQRSDAQEAIEVQTIRDTVVVPSVEAGLLGDGIGYARLVQFRHGTASDLTVALDRMESAGPLRGLVLDLRDNPGGLLEEAIAVSDVFLDNGLVVSTRSRVEGEEIHRATSGGRASLPVAVLINGGSASASEIVGGALRDHDRAKLVGTATFGKGSVQTVYENTDMSALKLTIGAYYTPSGHPVTGGIEPDVVVPLTRDKPEVTALMDHVDGMSLQDDARTELVELIEALPLPHPDQDEIRWDLPIAERMATDDQLTAAIDLLSEP